MFRYVYKCIGVCIVSIYVARVNVEICLTVLLLAVLYILSSRDHFIPSFQPHCCVQVNFVCGSIISYTAVFTFSEKKRKKELLL